MSRKGLTRKGGMSVTPPEPDPYVNSGSRNGLAEATASAAGSMESGRALRSKTAKKIVTRNNVLPPNLSQDSDSEEGDGGFFTVHRAQDGEVIKIERHQTTGQMVCYRCPSLKKGTFTDREEFQQHIKRHLVQGQFSCPHDQCHRPFVKYMDCISHEMRAHGQVI